MKTLKKITLTLFLMHLSCAILAAPKIIEIDTIGNAKFDVLYHRVNVNNTGAIIGGLIGAGIQAGIESGKDKKKLEELQPHIPTNAWQDFFIEEMDRNLKQKNYSAKWVDKSNKKTQSTLIILYPELYGFKLVDANMELVSAFVSFKAQLVHNGKKYDKQDYYIAHKKRRTFEELVANKEIANSELKAVLIKAARRLSNKTIYKTKGK